MVSTSPRTTRAIGGQLTVAMAMTRLVPEGARMATNTMAKMKEGMVWKNSLTRISTIVDDAARRSRQWHPRSVAEGDRCQRREYRNQQRGARAMDEPGQ